jgi:hypothetical protein
MGYVPWFEGGVGAWRIPRLGVERQLEREVSHVTGFRREGRYGRELWFRRGWGLRLEGIKN